MYHINDDPRCIKSCNLIYNALMDLLKQKHMRLNDISVSEISATSSVGRATFYRHFDSPLDVLKWASNKEVEGATDAMLLFTDNYQLFCYNFFAYWTEHSELLETLVAVKQPIIFLVSIERFLTHSSNLVFHSSTLSEDRQTYLVSVWSAIVWTIMRTWVLRGEKETAAELCDIAIHNLPLPH